MSSGAYSLTDMFSDRRFVVNLIFSLIICSTSMFAAGKYLFATKVIISPIAAINIETPEKGFLSQDKSFVGDIELGSRAVNELSERKNLEAKIDKLRKLQSVINEESAIAILESKRQELHTLNSKKFVAYQTPLQDACAYSNNILKDDRKSLVIFRSKGKEILGISDLGQNCRNVDELNSYETVSLASDNPLNGKSKIVEFTIQTVDRK